MSRTIWILDDQHSVHVLFDQLLGTIKVDEELVTRYFFSGDDLKRAILSEKPDILLVDVRLQNGSGIDFLNSLKELVNLEEIEIYMLSNSINPDDIKYAWGTNVIKDYIPKPITRSDIQEIVFN